VTQQDAEQMPASHREWVELVARIRFGTVKIAGKNYTALRIKAVAGRVASYADSDGTRVRPGVARVAADLETEYRTVRDVIAYLRRLGLLQIVRAGGGTKATEYRLTLPTDLLDRDDIEVWSPSRQAIEIDRIRTAHRGGPRKPPRGPRGKPMVSPEDAASDESGAATQGPEDSPSPVDNSVTLRPEDPTSPSGGPTNGESSGTCVHGDGESSGAHMVSPQDPTTYQDQDTTPTDQCDGDVTATVTTPGAPDPTTNPEPPRPERCEHGLEGGHRRDGQLACPICRRLNRTATAEPGRLAAVISLNARRTA
jgi:hypothetical protein